MSRVRNRNTKPEVLVRSVLHRLGYRFRIHRSDLPGTPDIVLPKYGTVIFVNGCFWHGHNCSRGKLPATNRAFWEKKIEKNRKRDQENYKKLEDLGWNTIVVWTCRISSRDGIEDFAETIVKRLSSKT